jgi:hypothetical protein
MCAAIIAMMAIANLQYAWRLFTKPLTEKPARDTHRGAVLNFHTRAVEQCKPAARCCVQGLMRRVLGTHAA